MKARLDMIIILASIACACVTVVHSLSLGADMSALDKQADRPMTPHPLWEVGTWWITESHILVDTVELPSGPPRYKDVILRHKWVVNDEANVGGRSCFVVHIFADDIPGNIVDDHKGEPLFSLYISKETRAGCKVRADLRGGLYLVTGTNVRTYELDYDGKSPVIVAGFPEVVPLDIPLLPEVWPAGDAELEFSQSGQACVQRLQPIRTPADARALFVSLSEKSWGHRMQVWEEGACPWWTEWRRIGYDGTVAGLWRAETIDWKGRKDAEGTAAKAAGGQ